MDYETVTSTIIPGAPAATSLVSKAYLGHVDCYDYTYNLEKAEEELKQSKYYENLDDYPIDIVYSADVEDEGKIALLLQAAATQIGITVKPQSATWGTICANAESIETSPHGTICLPSDSYGEAGSVLALRFHSNTAGTFTQFEWLQDTKLDQMIDTSLGTIDQAERIALYGDIQRYVAEYAATVVACELPERHGYQTYLNWGAVEASDNGTLSCPIMGRMIYLPEITFAD